jgi:hypothetical protein
MATHLRSISPDATPQEVAAIIAAVSVLQTAAVEPTPDNTLHEWVRSARLASRRSRLQRGPWRLSARIGRRIRA